MRRDEEKKIAKKAPLFLPHEIFVEILSRLPVKSLLRFKLVCKQWDDIIKDDKFVEMHARHYKSTPYIYPEAEGEEHLDIYDGLLLLEKRCSNKYYIRNVSTKQILCLPDQKLDDPQKSIYFMRIFYNSLLGTYNVVSVIYTSDINGRCDYEAQVLNLGSDDPAWRCLNIHKLNDTSIEGGVFIFSMFDSVLYFFELFNDGSSKSELSCMDLENETCVGITMPRDISFDNGGVELISWDEMPALVYFVQDKLNVWVLEDYKKHKWADRIVIDIPFIENNMNLKHLLGSAVAEYGSIYFLNHDSIEESFEYVIASKQFKQYTTSGGLLCKKSTLITLKGMHAE